MDQEPQQKTKWPKYMRKYRINFNSLAQKKYFLNKTPTTNKFKTNNSMKLKTFLQWRALYSSKVIIHRMWEKTLPIIFLEGIFLVYFWVHRVTKFLSHVHFSSENSLWNSKAYILVKSFLLVFCVHSSLYILDIIVLLDVQLQRFLSCNRLPIPPIIL